MKKNYLLISVYILSLLSFPLSYWAYGVFVKKSEENFRQIDVENPNSVVVEFETPETKKVEVNTEFVVQSCRVADGFRFEFFCEGGHLIKANLAQATTEEALGVVVELLKVHSKPAPTIVLRRPVSDYWIVDLTLTVDGKRVNVLQILKDKKLLINYALESRAE